MKTKLLFFIGCLTSTSLLTAFAHEVSPSATTEKPQEKPQFFRSADLVFSSTGNLAKDGLEQVNLVGSPTQPGKYVLRLRAKAGYTLMPHSHPDTREITILKGMWCTGYGDTFNEADMHCLTAGDIYTEPAGVNHFVKTKEETIIQVHGVGVSGRRFVDQK
jgi:quercetin dioxygenase-like cupin family protein